MVNNMSPQDAKRTIERIKLHLSMTGHALDAMKLGDAIDKLRAISYRIGMQA